MAKRISGLVEGVCKVTYVLFRLSNDS